MFWGLEGVSKIARWIDYTQQCRHGTWKIECWGTDMGIGKSSMYIETFKNCSVLLRSQKSVLFMSQKCPRIILPTQQTWREEYFFLEACKIAEKTGKQPKSRKRVLSLVKKWISCCLIQLLSFMVLSDVCPSQDASLLHVVFCFV